MVRNKRERNGKMKYVGKKINDGLNDGLPIGSFGGRHYERKTIAFLCEVVRGCAIALYLL